MSKIRAQKSCRGYKGEKGSYVAKIATDHNERTNSLRKEQKITDKKEIESDQKTDRRTEFGLRKIGEKRERTNSLRKEQKITDKKEIESDQKTDRRTEIGLKKIGEKIEQ